MSLRDVLFYIPLVFLGAKGVISYVRNMYFGDNESAFYSMVTILFGAASAFAKIALNSFGPEKGFGFPVPLFLIGAYFPIVIDAILWYKRKKKSTD